MTRTLRVVVLIVGLAVVGAGAVSILRLSQSSQVGDAQIKARDAFVDALKSGSNEAVAKLATADFAKGLVDAVKAREIDGTASAWTRGATFTAFPVAAIFDLTANNRKGANVPFSITLKPSSSSDWRISSITFDLKQ